MLTYAVVTPARDEAGNIVRLATALAAQTVEPARWVVVDNGSTDETASLVTSFAAEHPWAQLLQIEGSATPKREGAIARAMVAGVAALDAETDVIVKVDADIDFDPDYFERLLERFAEDPALAIASGSALEQDSGAWRQRYGTGFSVWGAARAWRRSMLETLLPLDERVGWDGIDVIRANMNGWHTTTFLDLTFRHHRREGDRDGTVAAYVAEGRLAHYLGYRMSYLTMRAAFNAVRRPAGAAIVWGYVGAVLRREPRYADPTVIAYLRDQQRLRHLPRRAREASGR